MKIPQLAPALPVPEQILPARLGATPLDVAEVTHAVVIVGGVAS